MHSPSKILLRSFLAPEQRGEEPRAESGKSQNNTFHNLVVTFIRAGREESPSPALGARGMQINRTLAPASRNNPSDVVVEPYSLIFLCGVGGIRESFGKKVAFRPLGRGRKNSTDKQQEWHLGKGNSVSKYGGLQCMLSAG